MRSNGSVTLNGVTYSYGPKTVLDDVSFTITSQSRVGIAGRNGSGKSTLLKLIVGQLTPDAGSIDRAPKTTNIGLLRQEPERRSSETVDAFIHRRTGVSEAADAFEAATQAMAENYSDAVAEAYDVALQRYLSAGVADFDARIGSTFDDLGIPMSLLTAQTTTLSGGQAAKVSLAAIILSAFDILLLDEPTNDVDFAGLERLERFVTEEAGGVVIVSHDRDFLARTTNAMIELDAHSHRAREYRGGYTAFLEEKAIAQRQAEEQYGEYQAQRANLAGRAQTQRQWADQGVSKAKKSGETDKNIRHHNVSTSEKQASKAKQTEKAMERLEVVEKPFESWQLNLVFGAAGRSGDVVAQLTDAVIERGTFSLGPVSEQINFGERVAIVGPNGAGKSTFLAALLGRLPLTAGAQYLGPGVIVGEIDQTRALLIDEQPLSRTFSEASGLLPEEARSLLAKFDLTADHVKRTAAELSPGERTRATLALLMARNTNCLVLDEPTNHLDIEAIEQLEIALGSFEGTVLLVTHDRALLDRVNITRTITLT